MTLAEPRKRRWTSDEYQQMADAGFKGKHGFAKPQVLTPGQSIAPIAAPKSAVAVADMLP